MTRVLDPRFRWRDPLQGKLPDGYHRDRSGRVRCHRVPGFVRDPEYRLARHRLRECARKWRMDWGRSSETAFAGVGYEGKAWADFYRDWRYPSDRPAPRRRVLDVIDLPRGAAYQSEDLRWLIVDPVHARGIPRERLS